MSAAVLWFRRDLRLGDHPALAAAAQEGLVVALFVLDDALRRPSGAPGSPSCTVRCARSMSSCASTVARSPSGTAGRRISSLR